MISSLIRRLGFRFERPCRFLATQASPPPPSPPPLPPLLASWSSDPDSWILYAIGKDHNNLFHLDRHPDVSFSPYKIMAPGSQLIGFSNGFFISGSSSSSSSPLDLRVVNPVTGASLDLPAVAADVDPKYMQVILSPSLDKAIFLHCQLLKPEFARLPALTSPWIPLPTEPMCLENCVFHKGRLFGVDTHGDVAIFGNDFFNNPSASSSHLLWNCEQRLPEKNLASHHLLVESPDGDDLYLLFQFRDDYKTLCFMLHKFDGHAVNGAAGRWNEVESIGDLAMFVGRQHAIALPTTNFPALEPDAIYFTTNFLKEEVEEGDDGGYDTGVYYLRSNCVHHFDVPGNHILNNCPLMWFDPAAF